MRSNKPEHLLAKARLRLRAFTLVEILVSLTLAVLVLGAVASIVVMTARLAYKNQRISDAVTTTRQVQEHMNEQISTAVSQSEPVAIKPQFGGETSTTTPQRFTEMTYRVPIGSFATVYSDTSNTSDQITAVFADDMDPKIGDYLLMDTPDLGVGIKIVGRNPASGSGTVTIALEQSILAGTRSGTQAADASAGSLIRIQRERKYEAAAPIAGARVTELRWYETTEPDSSTGIATYRVLSKNLDANARYMFAEVVNAGGTEAAVSWQFSYATTDVGATLQGSVPDFYQTAYAEGLIMPKSGNPLNAASIISAQGSISSTSTSTTTSTTSSTTSSTTTSTTSSTTSSSTSTTSSKTTSSTSSSKTTTSSTSSKSTTSTSTSKTTTSTTSSTSKSTTSTTSTSTSSTTSKSTTSKSTTSKSTTSKSTTSTTSSSSKSTTSTSTSKTTSSSTSSTTSKSTTSTSTSTSKTSTSSTTSMSTSSTTSSTTSSKSTTSTTSKTTTTSIPFDG